MNDTDVKLQSIALIVEQAIPLMGTDGYGLSGALDQACQDILGNRESTGPSYYEAAQAIYGTPGLHIEENLRIRRYAFNLAIATAPKPTRFEPIALRYYAETIIEDHDLRSDDDDALAFFLTSDLESFLNGYDRYGNDPRTIERERLDEILAPYRREQDHGF